MAAQDDGIDPRELEEWAPAEGTTFSSILKTRLPARPTTSEGEWLQGLGHIVSTMESFWGRRRFMIHYPSNPPFELCVIFDVADPIKACPESVPGAGPGAPLQSVRYATIRTGDDPQLGKALSEEFYKSQRDGFVNAVAAVVPKDDSVTGLTAPSLSCIRNFLSHLERNAALLAPAYVATFARSLKPSFFAPPEPSMGHGDYVELRGMKSVGYDGLQGLIIGVVADQPGRWAVMPQRDEDVATATRLRGGDGPLRPLAIKPENLKVIPRPAEAEAEECD